MGAAAVMGGASLLGAGLSANAAAHAATDQHTAAAEANAIQAQQYAQQRQDEQPFRDAGASAMSQLTTQLPSLTRRFSTSDFREDPGYQFALNQGLEAMQRSAAAKGLLGSTGTLKHLNDYAQGMADQQYGNAYNRFTQSQQQKYNMLANLSSIGQNAAANTGSASQNFANQVGQNYQSMGNAAAAGSIGTANAINQGIGQGTNSYMQYQLINSLGKTQQPMTMSGLANSYQNPEFNYTSPTFGSLGA